MLRTWPEWSPCYVAVMMLTRKRMELWNQGNDWLRAVSDASRSKFWWSTEQNADSPWESSSDSSPFLCRWCWGECVVQDHTVHYVPVFPPRPWLLLPLVSLTGFSTLPLRSCQALRSWRRIHHLLLKIPIHGVSLGGLQCNSSKLCSLCPSLFLQLSDMLPPSPVTFFVFSPPTCCCHS